jgi:hypothetical protein
MEITRTVDKDEIIRYINENGLLHREDGPAYLNPLTGTKAWVINGKCHREDGPAIENVTNGTKIWYLQDKKLTEEEFNDLLLRKRLQRIIEL